MNYAINSMYVAYSPSQNTHVVAIAGTNPKNVQNWLTEDLDVSARHTALWPLKLPFSVVDHDPYPKTDAQISAGTATGINDLICNMTDTATGTNIQEFLAGIEATPNPGTLVFTGHSLGGALAPALAFYLYPNPKPTKWAAIRVFPYAGATPGNDVWLTQFNTAYPSTTDVVNAHDVVPTAWNNIRTIVSKKATFWRECPRYDSIFTVLDAELGIEINGMVDMVIKRPAGVDYANIPHQTFGGDTDATWGTYRWTETKTPNGKFLLKSDPQWVNWAKGTREKPITKNAPAIPNSTEKPTSARQIGNLIMATHIAQYFQAHGVTPMQYLPGLVDPKSFTCQN